MKFAYILTVGLCCSAANLKADSVIVFNELMYHPVAASPAAESAAEWVELCNQMAVDVDVSGWSLAGGVSYRFPSGTIMKAGAYLVVAATPAAFPGAMGPWTGKLDNGGEQVELRNNNGRVMDEISYGTDGGWPVAPDGGGASLAKRSLNIATGAAASWHSSGQSGGTPGVKNPGPSNPSLVLNEVSLTGVEIMNTTADAMNLAGTKLRRVNATGITDELLPVQSLAGMGFLRMPLNLTDNERLILVAPDGTTLLDSMVVNRNPRARFPDGSGPWRHPTSVTAGAANHVTLRNEIVINEIMYDHPSATLLSPGAAQPGQWLELFNKSATAVDLSGWKLDRGVKFAFAPGTLIPAGGYFIMAENPATFRAAHAVPPGQVFGPWSGNLSHGDDFLVLEDAAGNPADEVHFFSDGYWPAAANAGGSSLELTDVRSDNSAAEAWEASDESSKVAWQTLTWRAMNTTSISGEPTLWKELNILLVDGPGECLIDDVQVTDTTTNTNRITNGDFSNGAAGWRLLGNHRGSAVQPEPGNPGNNVLRLTASGPGEYQGNQVEITNTGNLALVANREYEFSLRARWLSGGSRLHVREYFGRMPRTHLLSVVANGGTPGAVNSRAAANSGPVYHSFSHSPAVPAAGQPVTVSLEAADPDGVAGIDLKYSVSGAAWQMLAMASTNGRTFTGTISGLPSGTVQFYAEGRDTSGVISYSPARGPLSRSLYVVQDGRGTGLLQKVRLVMKPVDAAFMHSPINTLSNEELGATVIVNDKEVYYDVGVRLKGSFVGRNVVRVGFNLLFHGERRFRGVHDKVAVDRSQHASVGGVGEIIVKHIAGAAGGIPGMYDDLAQFVHPSTTYSGMSQLRMAGFEKEYLDSQYPNGGDGTMFEMEVFRWNLSTLDGNPTSQKMPGNEGGGTGYLNIDLGNYGTSKEAYRWFMLQTMGRDQDDYSRVIPFCQMFALNGAAFDTEARQRLDHDAFLRTMAYQSLVGPADSIHTGGNHHNCRFYFRPNDGKALFMPWDWDSAWQRGTSDGLVGTGNLAKVVTATPNATRQYYSHLYDLIQTTFNTAYMTRWMQHYGTVSGQNLSSILSYIGSRATFVLSRLPTTTAFTAVAGTPNANGALTLTGTGNIKIASLEVNGLAYSPLWTSTTAWSLTVPLVSGPNSIAIRGLDRQGTAVAGAAASIDVDNPNASSWAPLRINEWMAGNEGSTPDPADGDSDDWFELCNPTALPINLAGWKLSDSTTNPAFFTIPAGWTIPANGYLLIWADNESAQNPAIPAATSQLHVNFKLDNDGESLILTAPDNREIDRVSFGPQTPDNTEGRYADSSQDFFALTLPSPGSANVLSRITILDLNSATPQLGVTSTPGLKYQTETSTDLNTWLPWEAPITASGSGITIPISLGVGHRYYRIRTAR